MGEKGNVVEGVMPSSGAAASAGEGVVQRSVSSVVETTTNVVSDTADAVRGAAIGVVAGEAVERAAERVRRDEEDESDEQPGGSSASSPPSS